MHSLSHGHAVITGAASDTGVAIAFMFARSGCESIFLGDLSTNRLEECRDSISVEYPGVKVHFKALDRSNESDVNVFYAEVNQTLGRIDFSVDVVSTQGQDTSSTRGLSIEKYDQCFSVSQKGAFLIQRGVLQQMLKQEIRPETDCRGSIVKVVEYGPPILLAHDPIIAAVANAVIGQSKTDAFDYIPDKIRVNCIAAGEVLTAGSDIRPREGTFSLRNGKPDDVANAAAWLSSPAAGWMTGVILPVDGGLRLNSIW